MTTRQFDAPASITRPVSSRQDRSGRSVTRRAWLLGRFIRREPVRYAHYKARFGESSGMFHGDIATLRAARIYRGAEVLGNDVP
jgi:hypothetical protein